MPKVLPLCRSSQSRLSIKTVHFVLLWLYGPVQSTIGCKMLPLDYISTKLHLKPMGTHATMLAQPMSRQCFSIRRDSATFSPISVHAGDVRERRAASAFTAMTLAPVAVEPMLTICAYVSLLSSQCQTYAYQDFVLRKLGDLGLLAVRSLNTKQSSKEEVVDFKFSVNVG
jgi:hypothetical protein